VNRNFPERLLGMETEVQLEAMETPEGRTFREIAHKDGLKAALAWRDARFGEA